MALRLTGKTDLSPRICLVQLQLLQPQCSTVLPMVLSKQAKRPEAHGVAGLVHDWQPGVQAQHAWSWGGCAHPRDTSPGGGRVGRVRSRPGTVHAQVGVCHEGFQ